MIKRLPSRNHRSKGIKIKHVLQIILLLGVCFWLIYQIKHSHDKKKEFDENDAKASIRMQTADQIPKLGRKDIQPHKDDIIQDEKHEEEEEDENIVEDEGKKHENDEQEEEEEGNKHQTEEKRDRHEVREREEEEESKHGAEEQEEDENKSEEMEDDGRGGGDDEMDENEQDKSELDTDRDVEFMDEEKEKEKDDDEKENENSEDEEKESLVENKSTHEAREEHYKADDASSAVAHDTQTINTETEISSSENSNENSEMTIMKQENQPNYTEESNTNQNDSGKITEDQLKDGSALNTTAGKESGNTVLSNPFDSSNMNTTATANSYGNLEASSNHTLVIPVATSNATGDGVNTSGSSEHNKMVIDSEHSENSTVDITATGGVKNGKTEELGQSDNRVEEDNWQNTNITVSVKMGNEDAAAGESSNSGAGELDKTIRHVASNETQNNSRNSYMKENIDASVVEKSKVDTEMVETNQTRNSSEAKENNDTIEVSDTHVHKDVTEVRTDLDTQPEIRNEEKIGENSDATKDEKSKDDSQSGGTDETSDSSSVNGVTSDLVEHDAIDASDTHIHKDVTEVRTNLDTLPDIRNEGNIGEETAAE